MFAKVHYSIEGMVGVLRAYVATASTNKDRVSAIAMNTAFFTGGIAVGPGLQVAFSPIGYPGWFSSPNQGYRYHY
jgi:hypothetical protein